MLCKPSLHLLQVDQRQVAELQELLDDALIVRRPAKLAEITQGWKHLVCPDSFSVLDVLSAPQPSLNNVEAICSDRLATLASSHFPVAAVLCTDVELDGTNNRPSQRKDWSRCKFL